MCTSFIHRTRSIRYVPLAVWTHFTCIRPHFDLMTITSDSISAGTLMSFTTQIVAYLLCTSIEASGGDILVKFASVLLPSTETGAECLDIILRSMENVPQGHLSIYVVSNMTFTDRFRMIPNQIYRFFSCMTK